MKNYSEIEKIRKEIENASECVGRASAALYRAMEENPGLDDYYEILRINGFKDSSDLLPYCSYDHSNSITTIRINNIPPIINRDVRDIRTMWVSSIRKSLQNMVKNDTSIKQYDKAFIIIKYYVPSKHVLFDNDNRSNKYIIDGIKFSHIINGDDDYEHVSYAVLSIKEETCPHTEVYIINHYDLAKKLPLLG